MTLWKFSIFFHFSFCGLLYSDNRILSSFLKTDILYFDDSSEQELCLGICFIPVRSCYYVCSYFLSSCKWESSLSYFYYLVWFSRDFVNSQRNSFSLCSSLKYLAQRESYSLGAPFFFHWLRNCNKYKFFACGVPEMESKAKLNHKIPPKC